METSLIFLDIDGPIATDVEFMRKTLNFQKKYEWAKELRVPYPYNPGCVKIFNEILSITDAEIVLTSDWKNKWSLDEMNLIFQYNGIKCNTITKKTGIHPISFSDLEKNRSNEINLYLKENPSNNYVILDDLNLNRYLNDNSKFILIHSNDGLKRTGIKKKILKVLGYE
jgi:hypothetical protein